MFLAQNPSAQSQSKRTCRSSHGDHHVKPEIAVPQSAHAEGTKMFPRDVRKAQIEEQVALHQSINHKPLTMRQIAQRIHMSPGGHLMDILWEMADEQRLIPSPREYRETMTAWDFKLPPDRVSAILERVYEVAR